MVVAVVPPLATIETTNVATTPVVVAAAAAAPSTTKTESNGSGPRVAGARRSTERIRKKSIAVTEDNIKGDDNPVNTTEQ